MELITYLFESNFTRESCRTESFSDAGWQHKEQGKGCILNTSSQLNRRRRSEPLPSTFRSLMVQNKGLWQWGDAPLQGSGSPPQELFLIRGHPAMSTDILGCHKWGEWCYWHPRGGELGLGRISYCTEERPHHRHPQHPEWRITQPRMSTDCCWEALS